MERYHGPFLMLLAALLGCVSCEYEFPLEESSGGEGRLYVNCLAGYADSTFVDVQTSLPLDSKDEVGTVTTEIERLTLEVNGVPAEMHPYQGNSDPGRNVYYLPRRVNPSDALRLRAKAKGMEEVCASIDMPPAPVIGSFGYSVGKKGIDEFWNTVNVDILVGGEVTAESFYGVQVMCRSVDGDWEGEEYGLNVLNLSEEEVLSSEGEFGWIDCSISRFGVESFAYDYGEGGGTAWISLFDGRSLLGNDRRIRFSVIAPPHAELRVLLSGVSPSFYRYAKACYHRGNNILATLGLAPALFSYTNIDGGFGVLSGISTVSTEVFKP